MSPISIAAPAKRMFLLPKQGSDAPVLRRIESFSVPFSDQRDTSAGMAALNKTAPDMSKKPIIHPMDRDFVIDGC